MNKIRAIVACEESQAVLEELLKLGVDAYSCDLLPASGKYPERHFQEDIFQVLKREEKFDLMIAHPPCTFIAQSGTQWLSHPEDKNLPFEERRPHPKYPNRRKDMEDSIQFVLDLYNSSIQYVAIENPIGLLSSKWRKPDQIIQPYEHGDKASKNTCLWVKNLPLIKPTNIVEKGDFFEWIDKKGVKKKQPRWYYEAIQKAKTPEQRRTLRSKTFPGIAKALATQYVSHILNQRDGR